MPPIPTKLASPTICVDTRHQLSLAEILFSKPSKACFLRRDNNSLLGRKAHTSQPERRKVRAERLDFSLCALIYVGKGSDWRWRAVESSCAVEPFSFCPKGHSSSEKCWVTRREHSNAARMWIEPGLAPCASHDRLHHFAGLYCLAARGGGRLRADSYAVHRPPVCPRNPRFP